MVSCSVSKSLVLACLSIALAVGCGGGGGGDEPDADAEADPVVDVEEETAPDAPVDVVDEEVVDAEEDGPGIGPLTVVVVEASFKDQFRLDFSTDPVEGATVALDAPDGTRSEMTTGTDGRVTFEDVDWSLGTGDVTAYKEDLTLYSVVGLDGSVDTVTVGLWPADPTTGRVTLSGSAANMTDEGHWLGVYVSNVTGGTSVEAGPDWSLLGEAGVAFTLVGLEFDDVTDPTGGYAQDLLQWTMVEHAAVSSDTTVAVDFASTLTAVNVSNSITPPTVPPTSALFGSTKAYGWVETDGVMVGFIELTEPGSDGTSLDMDWEWVELTGASDTVTYYALHPREPGMQGQSVVLVPGYPAAGAHDLEHLDIPNVSQNSTTVYDLNDTTIEWESGATGVQVFVPLWKRIEEGVFETIWWIDGPVDSTTLDVPEPPSTVDVATVLGTLPLGMRVRLITSADSDGIVRFSEGKWMRMQP